MVVDLSAPAKHLRAELLRDLRAWLPRLFVAAMLAYDAFVHARLAEQRWGSGGAVTQGQLFAVEAAAAAVVAALLLLNDRRTVWAAAAAVALGGVVAVVVTRYVDIPAFGPFPSMYEPSWYAVKTWSALAEAAGGLVAAIRWGARR
jgi:hypothetical protein